MRTSVFFFRQKSSVSINLKIVDTWSGSSCSTWLVLLLHYVSHPFEKYSITKGPWKKRNQIFCLPQNKRSSYENATVQMVGMVHSLNIPLIRFIEFPIYIDNFIYVFGWSMYTLEVQRDCIVKGLRIDLNNICSSAFIFCGIFLAYSFTHIECLTAKYRSIWLKSIVHYASCSSAHPSVFFTLVRMLYNIVNRPIQFRNIEKEYHLMCDAKRRWIVVHCCYGFEFD